MINVLKFQKLFEVSDKMSYADSAEPDQIASEGAV